jgi:uncharacterized membrane protein YraQ (UPF0718 family)
MLNEIVEIAEFVAVAVWQVWPLFLISIVLSVLIRSLKLDGVIHRAFSANVGIAIVLATLVGAFSPFCSCTVVPVVAGLLLSGVPLAPIMAFWIASPTMDPEIFTLSVGVLGWPMAVIRLVATLVLSLAAGFITLTLTNSMLLTRLRVHISPRKRNRSVAAVSSSAATPGAALPLVMMASADDSTADGERFRRRGMRRL